MSIFNELVIKNDSVKKTISFFVFMEGVFVNFIKILGSKLGKGCSKVWSI